MQYLLQLACCVLAVSSVSASVAEANDLWLIGGDLQICSERNLAYCNGNDGLRDKGLRYRVTKDSTNTLISKAVFRQSDANIQRGLTSALETLSEAEPVSRSAFDAALAHSFKVATNTTASWPEAIPVNLYLALLDQFRQPVPGDLDFAIDNSRNTADKVQLKSFANALKGTRANATSGATQSPTVGIITTASAQGFGQVTFYQQLLSALELEPVWLPASAPLMLAHASGYDEDTCRSLVDEPYQTALASGYPELANALLHQCNRGSSVNGVIDQLSGLIIAPSPAQDIIDGFVRPQGVKSHVLTRLLDKFKRGTLKVLAIGTGAMASAGGSFNQRRTPAITGGDSQTAFRRGPFALPPIDPRCQSHCPADLLPDDLTFAAHGGLGFFTLGTLDSETSSRDGHAKLALALAHTGTRFGIGLDQDSALLISQEPTGLSMSVAGVGGVTVIDSLGGVYKIQGQQRQVVGRVHYLRAGDSARWNAANDQLTTAFASNLRPLEQLSPLPVGAKGRWRSMMDNQCGGTVPVRWRQNDISYVFLGSDDTQFAISDADNHCRYRNMTYGMEN